MKAIVLRDMRTRYFNHGLGFLIVPLWPMGHMLIIMGVWTIIGRLAPFGDSAMVFFATGLIPGLSFMYVSRYMAVSLSMNKQLLSFPQIKVVDVMFGRAFLEIIGTFLTLVFMLIVLWAFGNDPMPHDPYQAVAAYLATILLAIGVGSIVAVVSLFAPSVSIAYMLFLIVIYLCSGTFFVANYLPDQITDYLVWNPLLHGVEWIRTAYYDGYSDKLLNKPYLIGFGLTSLCIGLFAERALRRVLMD